MLPEQPATLGPGGQDRHGRDKVLTRALSRSGVAVICQDADLSITWTHNLPSAWTNDDLVGHTDDFYLPPHEAARATAAKRRVLETGDPAELEIRMPDGNGGHWFRLCIDPYPEGEGHRIVTVVTDVTEQYRREQSIRVLLREVSHRSRNLLAVIQGVATQTGRYSDTIETFLTRFRGRLQSLAFSQDLVTSSNWRGVRLADLLRSQISRYVPDLERVSLHGSNPFLNPNAALHIGLALHELAINSISYGALSKPDGSARIDARVAKENGHTTLLVIWTEELVAGTVPFGERRFGSVALERVVPASLDGTASLRTGAFGLEYRLQVPEVAFAAD